MAAVKAKGRDENRREAVELLKQMESVIPYAERWLLGDNPDMSVVAPLLESQSIGVASTQADGLGIVQPGP